MAIRDDEINGGFGGIALFGGQARPRNTVRDGRLDGLRIAGNCIATEGTPSNPIWVVCRSGDQLSARLAHST